MDWFWRRSWGKKTYLMNKGFFFLLCVLVLGCLGLVLWSVGGSGDDFVYVSCPSSAGVNSFGVGGCLNPLFNSSDCGGRLKSDSVFCTTERLSAGQSLGTRPSWLVQNFGMVMVLIFGVVFVANHLLFNKGFFKD
jgi:hypothetical protein